MRLSLIAVVAAAAAVFATPAAAEGWRVEGGYTHYSVEDANVGGLTGRVGYDFNANVGVEGEASIGIVDDDGAELDNGVGAFVIGRLPFANGWSAHARVGYQSLEAEGGAEDDGVAYGVGGQYDFNDRFGVRADYTRLSGDFDTDQFGVTAVYKF
jgi:hypothetical protein